MMRDHISNLGENVLCDILSRLDDKKAAGRTCVLSKQWRWKWANFVAGDSFTSEITNDKSFNDFSERTLLVSSIKVLRAWLYDPWFDASRVEKWITSLLKQNTCIERLSLCYTEKSLVLPHNLFDGGTILTSYKLGIILPHNLINTTSLRHLDLGVNCSYRVTAAEVFFPNLKFLRLARVEIQNDNPETNIMSFNLPLVENVELSSCVWVNVKSVNIYAPALTKFWHRKPLCVEKNDRTNPTSIKIVGTRLVSVFIFGGLPKDLIMNCANVSFASFYNLADECHLLLPMKSVLLVERLLEGFSNVNELRLSGTWLMAITKSGLCLPKFVHLRRLDIDAPGDSASLITLLHETPSLKVLGIRMMRKNWVDCDYGEVEPVPSCISLHLEEVEFRYNLSADGKLVSHLEKVNFDYLAVPDARFDLPKFFLKYGAQLKRIWFYSLTSKKDEIHLSFDGYQVEYSRSTTCSEFSVSKSGSYDCCFSQHCFR